MTNKNRPWPKGMGQYNSDYEYPLAQQAGLVKEYVQWLVNEHRLRKMWKELDPQDDLPEENWFFLPKQELAVSSQTVEGWSTEQRRRHYSDDPAPLCDLSLWDALRSHLLHGKDRYKSYRHKIEGSILTIEVMAPPDSEADYGPYDFQVQYMFAELERYGRWKLSSVGHNKYGSHLTVKLKRGHFGTENDGAG